MGPENSCKFVLYSWICL